jgi:uncharacterized membrane protein
MDNIQYQRGAINPGDCIGGAWGLVTRQFGLYLGVGILTMLLISCVPFVNFFLLGPVFGGFYYLVLRDMRDEPVDFGMLFKGFEKFLPLMIVGLIQSAPSIIMTVIQYTVDFARLMGGGGIPGGDVTFYQGGADTLWAGFGMALIIGFIVLFFFSLAWHLAFSFAVPLVMEHDLSVGDALLTSAKAALANPGGLIVLMILQGLILILGVIALCVGIFVAFPVVYAAAAFAYRHVFPFTGGPTGYTGPPPPDVYDGSFGRGQ